MFFSSKPEWQHARDKKQAERSAKIAAGKRALGPRKNAPLLDDLPILSCNVAQLVHAITKENKWTATQVLEAYIRAAIRSQEANNCLTEIRFVEALQEAKQLDAYFSSHKKPKGSLHGIPISVKDQVNIAGLDSSCGLSRYCGSPAEEDGAVVHQLREAGAIIFAKTAVPQTMLSFECSSPVWGVATNPYSSNATPGGSSGGEAALISSDGSPVGLGSDIGGSCRIPAHYSGVFGLKTSPGRITKLNCRELNNGFESIISSFGPLGRCPEDLEIVTKVLIQGAKHHWHTENLVPLPWRDQPLPAKLKLGYYRHDNFVATSPACLRAVDEAVAALRQAGNELIELPPIDNVLATTIFSALTSADGHEGLFSNMDNDPPESFLFLLRSMDSIGPLRKGLHSLVSATVDAKLGAVGKATGKKSVAEMQYWQKQKQIFAKQMRTDLWKSRGLDGVIAPVQCIPALSPGQSWSVVAIAAWTYAFNVCESTAGVVPVTFVDAERDARPENTPKGDFSPLVMASIYGSRIRAGIYDPKKMQGLPVGVQVIGPQYCEEKVLGLMKVLDAALGERGFGPGGWTKRKG